MTAKTKDEWLKWYEERTGINDLELQPNETVKYHPEHGFAVYFKDDDALYIHHMCGDGKYWFKTLMRAMQLEGVEKLRAYTQRNPRAWARKYGTKITGYVLEVDIDELEKKI